MPKQSHQSLRARIDALVLMTKSRHCAGTQYPAGRQFAQD
jgi:hypothetical protein